MLKKIVLCKNEKKHATLTQICNKMMKNEGKFLQFTTTTITCTLIGFYQVSLFKTMQTLKIYLSTKSLHQQKWYDMVIQVIVNRDMWLV